jgi:pimeloyl-ACP methyl ester carboxylesterase
MHLLTVPGIHNSGPGHWQTRWEEVPGRVTRRFAPSSWDEPEAWDWVAAVERDLSDLGPDTVVVAHSMGCLAAAHVAATVGGFRGLVLVAPPDIDGPNFPCDARHPERAEARPAPGAGPPPHQQRRLLRRAGGLPATRRGLERPAPRTRRPRPHQRRERARDLGPGLAAGHRIRGRYPPRRDDEPEPVTPPHPRGCPMGRTMAAPMRHADEEWPCP